jgi:hypothetical protein
MKKTEPTKTHKQMVDEWKKDSEFNAAYNEMDTEFNLLRELLLARQMSTRTGV